MTTQVKRPCVKEERSIRIGSRVLPSRYFLAPLAGYTHLAFRRALRELGGLGLATTDLVHATSLLAGNPKALDLIATDDQDQPLSIQIFGSKPDVLAKAARYLEDHGYAGIDINMGCPMAKVNSQGGGARIACEADSACALVEQVVEAVHVPVTVKMRLGWDADNITAPQLAAAFEQLGVKAITIHGRTRAQGFHGEVDREGIRQVVEAVREIPVVGNGDVRTVDDALAMRRETGCHAVAIGRGAMLDPWIFRKLAEVTEAGLAESKTPDDQKTRPLTTVPPDDFAPSPPARSIVPTEPAAGEQIDFLQRHFWLMTGQHGDYACTLFRKFAGWYGAKLGIPEDLEARLRQFESFDEFESIVAEIRQRHGERKTTLATALIKVPNGPVERW